MSLSTDPRWSEALTHLPDYLGNHVRVSVTALALGLLISLPLAIAAGDARFGLGIERGALLVALAVGPQENVLAPVDQDAGLGFISRRNEIDRRYRKHGGKHRGNDDPEPLAHQRLAQQAQIDIARS